MERARPWLRRLLLPWESWPAPATLPWLSRFGSEICRPASFGAADFVYEPRDPNEFDACLDENVSSGIAVEQLVMKKVVKRVRANLLKIDTLQLHLHRHMFLCRMETDIIQEN